MLRIFDRRFILMRQIFMLYYQGTPAMTSRGCLEADFETMADFLFRAAQIANMLQREHGKLQKTISKVLESNRDILELRARVEAFATQFALPGFDI
jgi:glycine hydroxymethyltransferase